MLPARHVSNLYEQSCNTAANTSNHKYNQRESAVRWVHGPRSFLPGASAARNVNDAKRNAFAKMSHVTVR